MALPAELRETLTFILAGGQGERLMPLTAKRAKPAVPFGGAYRIIDFTLSNCVNSGLFDIGILTQYRPLSLRDHIGIGRPWDLDRKRGGVQLLQHNESGSLRGGPADAGYALFDVRSAVGTAALLHQADDQFFFHGENS